MFLSRDHVSNLHCDYIVRTYTGLLINMAAPLTIIMATMQSPSTLLRAKPITAADAGFRRGGGGEAPLVGGTPNTHS